jgi:large subunit ribosomal protein L21
MYAVIEESGGQRKVVQGQEILVDLVDGGEAQVGSTYNVDKILIVGKEGGDAKLGLPYVAGASIELTVVEPLVKGDKIFVQKFREAKSFKKKTGHRQKYTKVRVTAIKG